MKRLIEISKIFAFIMSGAAVIGLLFGVFKFVEGIQANTVALEDITRKVTTVDNNVKLVQKAQYTTDSTLLDLIDETTTQNESLQSLRRTFTNYLLHDNTLTKEEFYQYMSDLKNESQ